MEAYRKYGKNEPNYTEHLAKMEAELAAYTAKQQRQPPRRGGDMNALTVWPAGLPEWRCARYARDRAAAEQRIADLEAQRAAELGGDCDLSGNRPY